MIRNIIFNRKEFFTTLNRMGSTRLQPGLAMKVGYLSDRINQAHKAYLKERERILQDYCKRNEDGEPTVTDGRFEFEGENYEKVKAEIEELDSTDILEDISVKIKFSELKEAEERKGFSISSHEIWAIKELIDIDIDGSEAEVFKEMLGQAQSE